MTPLESFGVRLSTWFFQLFLVIMGALRPLGRYLLNHPRAERVADRVVALPEELFKKVAYNCQMCGQCILHSTGMTCPMNCPKNLRNGPLRRHAPQRPLRGEAGDDVRVGSGPQAHSDHPLGRTHPSHQPASEPATDRHVLMDQLSDRARCANPGRLAGRGGEEPCLSQWRM